MPKAVTADLPGRTKNQAKTRELRKPRRPASTPGRLRQEVMDLIVRGEISGGTRLDQRQLAKRLQTTTAPLREALSALETEGFLVREQGVGVFCRVYTVQEIEDMVELRGMLESLAARRATRFVTASEITELRELAARLGAPIPPDGEAGHVKTHVQFHQRVVEIARSPRLRSLLEHHHLIDGVLANIAPTLWASEPHDHMGLVEAIESGNPDRAEKAMRDHIAPTFEKRFAELRRRFGEGPILPFNPYRR